jgi:cytidine deaminase
VATSKPKPKPKSKPTPSKPTPSPKPDGARSPDDHELVTRALAALEWAYAPYSGFRVGATVIAGGQIYDGANVENASYGLAICAERTAVARAVVDGARQLELVVVASESSPPAAPCGMCRQTIAEFSDDPASLRIVCVNPQGERADYTLAELLPHGFTRAQLDTAPGPGAATSAAKKGPRRRTPT